MMRELPHNSAHQADYTLRGALDRAAEKLKGRFPDKPLVEAAIRYTIGVTYWSFGDEFHLQAEPHLARALELRRIHLGENHLETLRTLMMLASARRDVPLQREAVVHSRRVLGDEHELTQSCKFILALDLHGVGQHAEKETLFRELLAAQRQKLGSQHPTTAWTAHVLATFLYFDATRNPSTDREIEELYREALSASLQRRGDWSWHTLDTALRFGQFLRSRGRLEDAETVLQDGYARLESGPTPVAWTFPIIAELEALYQEWGKSDQVTQWRQKRELAIQTGLSRNSRLLRESLNDPGLLISHASLLSQIGRYEEAVAAYRLAIRLQPDNPRARHLLGDCLERQADYAAAEAEYREAIRLTRANAIDNDWHHHALGLALFHQSKFVEAEAEFRESIRLRPDHAWNHHWLGDALKHQSKWAEAEAAYRAAIRLDSSNLGRYVNLADTLAEGGKSAEALVELQTAARRQPTSASWQHALGHFLCYTMAQPDQALPVLQEAVRLDPNNWQAHYDVGSAYAFGGQWTKAAAAFERAVELNPGCLWSSYRWATLCLYTNERKEYRRACGAMLDRFGETKELLIADCTAKACSLAPEFASDAKQVMRLADLAMTGTENEPARKWYEITKGLVDYRAGRFGPAAEVIVRSAPSTEGLHRDALAFSILAMAQHRLGKGEEARMALSNAQAIIATKLPKAEGGETFSDDWHDWLHCQILCREAEGLLKKESGLKNSEPATGSKSDQPR
jgi:tetratricopeptide (TPR) repeat protein